MHSEIRLLPDANSFMENKSLSDAIQRDASLSGPKAHQDVSVANSARMVFRSSRKADASRLPSLTSAEAAALDGEAAALDGVILTNTPESTLIQKENFQQETNASEQNPNYYANETPHDGTDFYHEPENAFKTEQSSSKLLSPPAIAAAKRFMNDLLHKDRSNDEPDILPASYAGLNGSDVDTELTPAQSQEQSAVDPEVIAPEPKKALTGQKSDFVSGVHRFFKGIWHPLDAWVNSAAGYDEKILAAYGTPTDEKRRRNIGRAIVVATLVGALGWLVKISMAMPAPWGIVVGLVIASLYGVLSYSLESFFASNVNPFAPWWSKSLSLTGRALLSALIAFSGALPWVTMSLKGSIHLEMSKIGLQEQLAMREGIDKVHGVQALTVRGQALQTELVQWNDALSKLPDSIAAALSSADACEVQLTQLNEETPKRVADLSKRISVLERIALNANGDVSRINAVASERKLINTRIGQANKALSDKRLQCTEMRTSANAARDDHIKMATTQRQSAQMRLAQQRDAEQTALNQARQDTAAADVATRAALSENSSGEFNALISLLKTQLYAQFIAALIFLGLFMVDVLPLTLRLFARPGPYDAEKRADDSIRMMRAEGRELQANLMHDARRHEIASDEFRTLMQREMRPHIRSLVLNGVGRFVSKH